MEKKHILWLMPLCEYLDEFNRGKITKGFLNDRCKKCFIHGQGIHLMCLDVRNFEEKAPRVAKDMKEVIKKARNCTDG